MKYCSETIVFYLGTLYFQSSLTDYCKESHTSITSVEFDNSMFCHISKREMYKSYGNE